MAVSVRDVAAVAAVSVGTVSNVLNRPDKVAPATAERVLAAIDSLGFVRNDAARQLRAGRSRSIGLVVLDIRNPFFTDIARGAEERAAEKGMTLLVGSSQEDPDRERAYLDLFLEQRVSGVLLSPVADTRSRLERLRSNGVPVVLVDRQSKDDTLLVGRRRRRRRWPAGRPAPHRRGSAADRLRRRPDRRSARWPTGSRGARQAVRRAPGVELEVVQTDALTVLAGRAAGELIRERQPGDRPDAIFAANDLLAIGILQALMLPGGLRVPQDIALIGYDDIDFASASVVPLSSIRQPAGVIGRRAVELLLDESFAEDEERSRPTACSSSPS